MSKHEDNQLIAMGMNLGIYVFARLLHDSGRAPSPENWGRIAEIMSNMLEKDTGMPAEDLALHTQAAHEELLKKLEALDDHVT